MVELKVDSERMEEDLPKEKHNNNVKTKKEPAEPPSKRQELNIHVSVLVLGAFFVIFAGFFCST